MPAPLNILIVEDEAIIADYIRLCVEKMGHVVMQTLHDGEDVASFIKQHEPHVVLLDIQLGGNLDGIDVSHLLNKVGIPFIYISSNSDDRTLERVKLTEPLGFIFKPFLSENQLKLSLELLFNTLHNDESEVTWQNDSLFIKDKHQYVKILINDISFCEALDNYSAVYVGKERYILSYPLKSLEEKLPSQHFLRVHRSFLVNHTKISSILPKSVMLHEKEIPISETMRSELLKRVNTL
jgi:DNA-binding LytR/AlgR family response regulator